MTPPQQLAAFAQVVEALAQDEPDEARYRHLLEAALTLFPCDATALLRLEGDTLQPLAVIGLSHDTLGRRFRLQDHPRLLTLLQRRGPTRLAADCQLPDPYDGLVEGRTGQLEVHDCMGCPLYVDERPWGLLTLDALNPQAFAAVDLAVLDAFGRLAAAVVAAGERISGLPKRAQREQQLARALAQDPAPLRHRDLVGHSAPMRHLQAEIDTVAATNRELAAEVRAGRFRADLYHRLSAYPLTVPPLRERGRDVLLLAGGFLEENRVRLGLRGLRLAADAQQALLHQPWPGNVRELEHLIGRAALRARAQQPQPQPCRQTAPPMPRPAPACARRWTNCKPI